jgi:hypothetical protein
MSSGHGIRRFKKAAHETARGGKPKGEKDGHQDLKDLMSTRTSMKKLRRVEQQPLFQIQLPPTA